MESLTKGRSSSPKPIITNKDDHGYYDAGEEQTLSPMARLFHEPNFCVYVIAIMGFRHPINLSVMYEQLSLSLLNHPRLSSLQVVDEKNGGTMKWVLTNVNLNNHVIIPNIPQTLEDSPDKFVEDYVSNLSVTSIDSSKPMWDFHLLNLKTSDAESFGIFRIHHSLGDGVSLISVVLACSRKISNPNELPTIPTSKKFNSGRISSYSSDGGGACWQRWFMVVCMTFWLVWNTLVDIGYGMATMLFLKDTETPIKAPEGVELNPRRFVYQTVSLDDMKLIKNAMNLTINDVALGIIQAGLSRYLNRRYGEGKKDEGMTEKKNNLPKKKIRLRSLLAVNIRPSLGIQVSHSKESSEITVSTIFHKQHLIYQVIARCGTTQIKTYVTTPKAMADMMENNTKPKLGNYATFVTLPITIGIRDDPLDYVKEAKARVDRIKHSLLAIWNFSMTNLLFKLFGIKVAKQIGYRSISRTTFSFSNVVGPQEEIRFCGHALEFLAPSVFGVPCSLVIHFQSYVNKMTMVVSVDENIIPDPDKLLDDFETSLKLIKQAVYAKGLVKDDIP